MTTVATSTSHLPTLPTPLDLAVFRRMADMSNEAFFLTDATAHLRYVNERALSLSGYARDELLAMTLFDLEPEFPRERLFAMFAAAARGPIPPFEARTLRRDGVYLPTEVSLARVDFGDEAYLFGVVRDITERKQIEAVQRSFARRMLENLETERQRVARELHDDVGQAVATVGVLLHALEQTPGSIADELRPALAATHASIRQITESVARIVRDYHPAELLGLGFEDTLRAHVLEFAQRHGLALELATIPASGLLSPEQELHLYRIAQEALANVGCHARARRVTVRLKVTATQLVLSVRDDGAGFATDTRHTGGGLGLVTMRERAELMHAQLKVRSVPGRGTEVRVAVPIAPQLGGGPEPIPAPEPARRGRRSSRRRFRVVE